MPLETIVRLVKRLSAGHGSSDEARRQEREVQQAVERVVDQVDPRLRAVSRYRKRLFPTVGRALAYAAELAGKVPGPVRVDRRSWGEVPAVNALFGSPERMRWILTGPQVRRYVKDNPLGGDCFAVLAAMPHVEKRLGMELAGETVQREVSQTVMTFSEHEVGLVGEDEREVRENLAAAALDLLVALAIQDLTARESHITELDERLRILRLKRKVEDARSRGAAFILEPSEEHAKEVDALDARIAGLEAELAQARRGMETLDDRLRRFAEQMESPESLLGLEEMQARLDRMNIVRQGGEGSASLTFTRVRRGDTPARVVSLIRFPRSELLEEAERLAAVERHLT
jgi:hypothetical protein